MRRVWFKRQMKDATLAGRKTATTRTHPLLLGEVLAVSGSRFKAVPFAVIEILTRSQTTVENVIAQFYREDGFDSPEAMRAFAKKERLLINKETAVFFHRFKVVKELAPTPTPTPTPGRERVRESERVTESVQNLSDNEADLP